LANRLAEGKLMRQSLPKNALWLSLILASGLALAVPLLIAPTEVFAQTTGPSFSCRQVDDDSVEALICADADLSRQDRNLARAFSRARQAVRGSEGLGELLDSQQSWLRERAACADLRTQKGLCVSEITTKRIVALNQWASLKTNPSRVPTKTGTTQSSRPPQGPSFDCGRASTSIERMICADRGLSIADREMAGLYRRASLKVSPSDLRVLSNEQRAFLANRNLCSRRPEVQKVCLQTAYEMRNLRLNEWLSGSPAQ
jgi:uncharacterized protein